MSILRDSDGKLSYKSILRIVRYTLLGLSVAAYAYGWIVGHNLFVFWGIMTLYAHNIVYTLERFKTRFLGLIFYGAMFLFWLGWPFLEIVEGVERMFLYFERLEFTFTAITVTLLFIQVGMVVTEQILKRKPIKIREYTDDRLALLRKAALVVFAIGAVGQIALNAEKIIFRMSHEYVEYYTLFESQIPYVVYLMSAMFTYGVCFYLAASPKKRHAFFVLVAFVAATAGDFIVGMRGGFVARLVFAMAYYLIRDLADGDKRWFGKFEKGLVAIGIPLGMVALTLYNYLREGREIETGFFGMLALIFIAQGKTFDILFNAYEVTPIIRQLGPRCYTLGPMIDYFKYGSVGQRLFGTTSLGPGNNLRKALEGSTYSHTMSWVLLGERYLAGHGYGSSYLLEVWIDFGYVGIAVFSVLLGLFFCYAPQSFKKSYAVRVLCLLPLTQFFMLPRAEALLPFEFLYQMQFWLAVVGMFVLVKLFEIIQKRKVSNG